MFWKLIRVSLFSLIVILWPPLISATSLKVALYPYVPRIEQFKQVISEHWKELHPDVEITWAEGWDGGYGEDPQDDYDLFVFDATYFTYFKDQGWLLGLAQSRIDNFEDFLPFAIKGMSKDDEYWAIPQLGCTEYLIYDKNDEALSKASKLSEIVDALGKCTYHGELPPKGTGLMMDFSGGTTNAIYYVKTMEEITDDYPVTLPSKPALVNKHAMENLRTTLAIDSLRNAWYSGEAYQRGIWYAENHGRAYVGFSESLSQIPKERLPKIALKVMPWSDNLEGIANPLFYADAIGINPKTSERGTTELAVELANLMASTPVIIDSFKATDSAGPQYLMPVRHSVMDNLADAYPAYDKIRNAVKASGDPILLDLGSDARTWLADMKNPIKQMVIHDLKCYRDIDAGPAMDNNKAQTVCPGVCGDDNWNGQWTNKGDGSVCGCFVGGD